MYINLHINLTSESKQAHLFSFNEDAALDLLSHIISLRYIRSIYFI